MVTKKMLENEFSENCMQINCSKSGNRF